MSKSSQRRRVKNNTDMIKIRIYIDIKWPFVKTIESA